MRDFHPDDLDPVIEKWRAVLPSGEAAEIEARLRCICPKNYASSANRARSGRAARRLRRLSSEYRVRAGEDRREKFVAVPVQCSATGVSGREPALRRGAARRRPAHDPVLAT